MPFPIPSKEETDRFQEIEGVTLHYNELGSGPLFILTHGGGPGANAWDNTKWIFSELAKHFRTVLLDVPGYGESQKYVSNEDIPLDIYVSKYILGLMDFLGEEKAHLHGSSQFGSASVRVALDHPERVGKLVITCSAIGAAVPGLPEHERQGPSSNELFTTFSKDPTRENMIAIMQIFTKRPEFRTDEIVDMRFNAASRPGVVESRLQLNRRNSDLTPLLPNLQAESLILWGNEDNVSGPEGALRALYNMPKSRAVIFGDQSGHFVFQEHPDECAALVIDFLERGPL